MAAQGFIARVGGKLRQVFAVLASAGSADAGKIPGLDSAGKLDQTFINPTRTYTDTGTSGDTAQEKVTLNVSPSGASTKVSAGTQVETVVNTTNNLTTGSYPIAHKSTMVVAGSGTKDKLVVDMNQLNFGAGGLVSSSIGYEGGIGSIDASATVNGYAGFYIPNQSGTPNIGNIQQYYAFSCDYTEAIIQHAGIWTNPLGAQFAPTFHPGLRSGRYYSAPYAGLTSVAMAANTIYISTVYVPHRATLIELGVSVTATGTATLARLGLYQVAQATLVPRALPNEFSVTSTGAKTATISFRADPGVYMIALVFNGTCSINCESVSGGGGPASQLSGMYGATNPTDAGSQSVMLTASWTYGPLPSTNVSMSSLTFTNAVPPHLWFRV